MTHGTILGIDPGKHGAVVSIRFPKEGRPRCKAWAAEQEYVGDGDYFADTMNAIVEKQYASLAVLEKQQAYPGQGVSSTFSTGYGYGLWSGILAANKVQHRLIPPREWQKVCFPATMHKDMGKERGILVARERMPNLNLIPGKKRTPHDGIADAACLAMFGALIAGFTWEQILSAIPEEP